MHEDTVQAKSKSSSAPSIPNKSATKIEIVISTPSIAQLMATKSASGPIKKTSSSVSASASKPPRNKKATIVLSDSENDAKSASEFEASGSEQDDDDDDSVAAEESDDSPHSDSDKSPPPKKKPTKLVAKKPPPKASKKRKNSDSNSEPESDAEVAPAPKKRKTAVKKEEKPAKVVPKIYVKDPWGLKGKPARDDWTEMKCPPLEMFHFNRVVIDEYTYLEGKVYSMVTSQHSDHRWILSGTPPTQDFTSVKTIAAFMGVHLGIRDDFWEGQSKESLQRAKKRQRDQTSMSLNQFLFIFVINSHMFCDRR